MKVYLAHKNFEHFDHKRDSHEDFLQKCPVAADDFNDWLLPTESEHSRVHAGQCKMLEKVGIALKKSSVVSTKPAATRRTEPHRRLIGPPPALLTEVQGVVIFKHNENCVHSVLISFVLFQLFVGNGNTVTPSRWRRILYSEDANEFLHLVSPHVCMDIDHPDLKITLSGTCRGNGNVSPVTQEIKESVCGK